MINYIQRDSLSILIKIKKKRIARGSDGPEGLKLEYNIQQVHRFQWRMIWKNVLHVNGRVIIIGYISEEEK